MDNSRSFVVEYRKRDEPNWDNSNFAFADPVTLDTDQEIKQVMTYEEAVALAAKMNELFPLYEYEPRQIRVFKIAKIGPRYE